MRRLVVPTFAIVATVVSVADWSPAAVARVGTGGAQADTGMIRVYLLEHAIGTERYVITRSDSGVTLSDSFDFTDRGGRVELVSELRMRGDFTPTHLTAKGRVYRFVNVDTDVDVRGAEATVRTLGDTTRVTLPRDFFALPSYAPLAAQAMLVRYWEQRGRPLRIGVVPGDPTHPVTIAYRGSETHRLGERTVRLRRYSIDGVAWGRETLWLDDSSRFAAIVTRANMLPLEGVRDDLADLLPALQSAAISDRMRDLGSATDTTRPIADRTFALVGGRIVDGTGAAPIEDGIVLVRNGLISDVGPRRTVSLPPDTRTVDVRGKTIIPGLWDMHAHVATPEWGAAYLGVGVTSARDMGGERRFLVALRNALAAGRGLGPRMLLAGLVDGPGYDGFGTVWAATPDEGRAVVDSYHVQKFQQIKLYTLLAPDVVGAIIRRAHELGMTVTGHVPRAMSLEQLVDSGVDNVAHMPVRGASQIKLLADSGVAVDPTISWGELLGRSRETPIASFQPGFAEAPWPIVAAYGSVRNNGDSATIKARQREQLAVVKSLFDAGVKVVAGTDYGVPGFSLLRELELYVAAGLTPMDAIRSATAVPAAVMGLSAESGTIAPGKRADLVVLDGNPLEGIGNIRSGRWVVANGRMYDMAALRRSVGFTPRNR
jgi:imidazolonepropionase-like amidohydrolase